jgi:hypothetical protein
LRLKGADGQAETPDWTGFAVSSSSGLFLSASGDAPKQRRLGPAALMPIFCFRIPLEGWRHKLFPAIEVISFRSDGGSLRFIEVPL